MKMVPCVQLVCLFLVAVFVSEVAVKEAKYNKIEFQIIRRCLNSSENDWKFETRPRVNDQNEIEFIMNFTLEKPADEHFSMDLHIERWGGKKFGSILKRSSENICSSWNNTVPEIMNEIYKCIDMEPQCPIPAGNYNCKGFPTNYGVLSHFPHLFSGYYRMEIIFKYRNERAFCVEVRSLIPEYEKPKEFQASALIVRRMSSNRHIDSRREDFRRYLEATGVMDALTNALVDLYEESEKPENALGYILNYLGSSGSGGGGNGSNNEESRSLQKQVDDLKIKPEKMEGSVLKGGGDHSKIPQKSEDIVTSVGENKPGAEGDAPTVISKEGVEKGLSGKEEIGNRLAESIPPEAVA